jgi:carboxyl-terminal processing protease
MELNENQGMISHREQAEKRKAAFKPFIYATILASGVLIGMIVNTLNNGKQMPFANQPYNKIQDLMNFIDLKYVDTVNKADLVDKTIEKLLSNLDPHSVYIPAKDLAEMNESLEGNFEGIGIEFFIVQDTITVVTAISGGPAELVGLRAGDRIVKINDTIVAGTKIKETDVKKKLRGTKDTKVKVGVLSAGSSKLNDYTITRGKIPLYSVDAAYMVDNEVGYIRISNFGATTHQEFNQKLHDLEQAGLKKLIIDLRGNPGGYLQAATNILDELIGGDKLLVYTQGKAYSRQEYVAARPGLFERGPLAVLIDQGSASASEILSGAVQDWDRGNVYGRTSFGKGLVQEQYQLEDGSALRLTIARYYTPSGRSIQRPYDNGADSYYNEIYDRYERGEFVHEDSLIKNDTTTYRTASGRVVYGGGGIRPDVFVPIDTAADNDYYFSLRSYVPEFVYKYTSQHPAAMLDEFVDYATKAGWKNGKTRTEKSREKLAGMLKAFIAKQKWRTEGYYYIVNREDEVMKAAMSGLKP